MQVVKHNNAAAAANGSSGPLADISEALRRSALNPHAISINWGPQFADRFTLEETAALLRRFATLDRKLQADEEHFSPGYQSGPMRYFFNEMPADFGLNDFIASWS